MDLKELHFFRVIAELGSLSKAATVLRIAQPALSRYLRKLEHDLGVELLKRTSRGVTVTTAGEVLLKRTSNLEEQLDEIRLEIARHSDGLVGRIKIACMHPLSTELFPDTLKEFRTDHPKIALSLFEGYSGNIVEDLINRKFDVAVVDSPSHSHPDLTISPLWKEDVHLFASAKDPSEIFQRDKVTLEEILVLPVIMPSSIAALRCTIDRAFVAAGGHFIPALEANGPAMIFAFVEAGLGYGMMPLCSFYDRVMSGRLISVATDPMVRRKLCIITRTDLLEDKPVRVLYDLIRRNASRLSETSRFSSVKLLYKV